MYADNARISHRQLFRQMSTGLMGIYLLVIPVLPELRGFQGMLSLLTGFGIYAACCWFCKPPNIAFDRPAGKLLVLFSICWLCCAGVYLLLTAVKITEHFLIEDCAPWILLLLTGGAAFLGSWKGLERRGRMAEVSFPFLMVIVMGMLFLGSVQIHPQYLMKGGTIQAKGWICGTLKVCALYLPAFYLPFLVGNVENPKKARGVMGKSMGMLTGILMAVLGLLQGCFGLGGYEQKDYPTMDLMASIQVPGDFLERVDPFWILGILFSILYALGSVFFYQHEFLLLVKKEKLMPVTSGILLLLALVFLLTGLIGCGVPLKDRVFPLSMSVDYVDGQYELIYGIPRLNAMTGQKKEGTSESKPQAIVYRGKTLSEAEENFRENQKDELDRGHMKALILGTGILENQKALENLLDCLEKDASVAGNLCVFSSENPMELMSLDGQGKEAVGSYLVGILEHTKDKGKKHTVTLEDLCCAWHRGEERPKLPRVIVVNKKPKLGQYS